jgi:large subunit ribosomal protein L23
MIPRDVLKRPLVTEKNTNMQAQNKYAFEVASAANKPEIKEAVEKTFKVKVTDVNVINIHGKLRRVGRRQVMTPPLKKAIVTLKAGDKITIFEGV